MKTFSSLILYVLLSLSYQFSLASTVGFSSGNDFESFQYRGFLTVKCSNSKTGLIEYNSTFCRAEKLKPADSDYFQGPKGINADKVSFRILTAAGVERVRSDAYNGSLAKTVNKINLWNQNLFQKPILEKGENRIGYTLSLRGSDVAFGQFIAFVRDAGVKRCSDGEYIETTEAGCSPASIYCEQYYSDQRYCY